MVLWRQKSARKIDPGVQCEEEPCKILPFSGLDCDEFAILNNINLLYIKHFVILHSECDFAGSYVELCKNILFTNIGYDLFKLLSQIDK